MFENKTTTSFVKALALWYLVNIRCDVSYYGQLFVTLLDAVFHASVVYNHCAQLVDTLKKAGHAPTVLVLQTDGGPDHSLKRIATKVSYWL